MPAMNDSSPPAPGFLRAFASQLKRLVTPPGDALAHFPSPAPVSTPSVPAAMPPPDFEAKLEAFYRRLPLADADVVDVGAHKGRHAIPLARLVGMKGTVHAFEPTPAIRKLLGENLAAAGINNTVVLPYALSDAPGNAEFNFVTNLPEESGLKKRHSYNAVPSGFEKIPVKVLRLDDAIPASARIRFVKIDVEGGELDVLRGATRMLEASQPIVAFECGAASFLGYHDKPDEIFEIFATRGYRIWSITGVAMPDLDTFRAAAFTQAFWDYVAFPAADHGLHTLLAP
jgi:FkbM family methyltransferase